MLMTFFGLEVKNFEDGTDHPENGQITLAQTDYMNNVNARSLSR